MARRDAPDGRLRAALTYGGLAAAVTALVLGLQQLLLGGRLEQARQAQLGSTVAFQLRLVSLGLERFAPEDLAQLSGLTLAVGRPPAGGGPAEARAAQRLRPVAETLRRQLCRRLPHCPEVRPASAGEGLWVEAESPLESVWLLAPLSPVPGWPPGPLALVLALSAGGLSGGLAFLLLEVQRPLRRLEMALARVDLEQRPGAVPRAGTASVRRLTQRFNAMLERLEQSSRERSTMLAGIAHDLRSPLTRLRLRLAAALEQEPQLRRQAEADLDALERITRQFLLFAGAESPEPPLELPLDALLAEVSAGIDAELLTLALEPLQRRVRPTALARAVSNLLENAQAHGRPPLRLVLRGEGQEGFRLEVHDAGPGIPAEDWSLALQPFQRLDRARGGQGHCGLGLAIAERVAREHGGELLAAREPGGFVVVLRGRNVDGPSAVEEAGRPGPSSAGHIRSQLP
ncbi:MAG: ATP-binding protein [Synechococcaceae cyanobacterium]|nr:ATP-binding protein [Synechococcaceae cyanobacterium]